MCVFRCSEEPSLDQTLIFPFADYNQDYNFPDGAQNDLRYVANTVAENAWKDDWEYIGCWADNGATRMLQGFKTDSWQNGPDYCRAICADLGYAIAGMQYGVECYVSRIRYDVDSSIT